MRVWFLAVLVVFALGGCSTFKQSEERGIEYRLRQAGFKAVSASEQQLSKLPPYKMVSQKQEGRMIYRYADPAKGRYYEGGQKEWENYRVIARDTQERRVTNLVQIGPRRPIGPLLW